MIVGVEPLGHFHRGLRVVTARQLVILSERQGSRFESEPLRQRSKQRGEVQHRVVPGEIADGHKIQLCRTLQFPVALAQRLANATQVGVVRFSTPERFLSELEFAMRADARKTGNVSAGHAESLSE